MFRVAHSYHIALTLIAVAFFAFPMPAYAQFFGTEGTATREDFALPKNGPVNIVIFRPDVHVGEQTTAGLDQPNADWTLKARDLLTGALKNAQAEKGNKLVLMPELEGEQAETMATYRALFKAVADAALTHRLFPGERLPSKKKRFDWTLGSGTSKLGEIGGGEYGLFVYSYDSYGSDGRKAAQIIGGILGAGVVPAGVHIGYAALVDLKTGDLVWMNADISMGGDIRTEEGAQKRVKQLLEDFPARGGGAKVVSNG